MSDGPEVSTARGSEDSLEPPARASGQAGSTTRPTSHVDLYHVDPLSTTEPRFVKRLALDDPTLVKPDGSPTQLATGWATYAHASAPHTMDDCPHA